MTTTIHHFLTYAASQFDMPHRVSPRMDLSTGRTAADEKETGALCRVDFASQEQRFAIPDLFSLVGDIGP